MTCIVGLQTKKNIIILLRGVAGMQAGETFNRIFIFMSEKEKYLTQEIVKTFFSYKDGKLYWNVDIYRNTKKGSFAGTYDKRGYYCITFNKVRYLGHRIIFLFHHGFLPKFIDHIDGNKSNCLISNLRQCTSSQNIANTGKRNRGHSKYLGVYHLINRSSHKKYAAKNVFGKMSYFLTEKEAVISYNEYALKTYGEFAKLNIIKP